MYSMSRYYEYTKFMWEIANKTQNVKLFIEIVGNRKRWYTRIHLKDVDKNRKWMIGIKTVLWYTDGRCEQVRGIHSLKIL